MSYLAELNRRNVIRVALAYLAGAWLLIRIVETLMRACGMPEGDFRVPGEFNELFHPKVTD